MAAERVFPIKQMYDENGSPFYPITHIDLVLGDKNKLLSLGNTISTIDLSKYLVAPFTGTFKLYTMNSLIYIYEGIISYTEEGLPVPYDTDIIVARDIPEKYRSAQQYIQCTPVQGYTDTVIAYIDTAGKLIMRVTPKGIYKDTIFESDYRTSVSGLTFNSLYLRNGLEE